MKQVKQNCPGVLCCLAAALPAYFLGRAFPIVGGPVFAILLGMLLAGWLGRAASLQPGIRYTSKKVLQYAVILLGFGMNLTDILAKGRQSLPIILSTITVSLLIAYGLFRLLKMPAKTSVLVGVGSLGRALLGYGGFAECGLNIVAAFDANPALAGKTVSGKRVFPMEKLRDMCSRMGVHIGIITVPAGAAQGVCDALVSAGVLAIWNFAPVHLQVPADILVQSENMAASLALLSNHLRDRFREAQG